jgi:hypothetical protein
MGEPEMAKVIDFDEWVEIGTTNNWITPPFCMTHDGDPYMNAEEEQEWEDGGDPCCPVFKIVQ